MGVANAAEEDVPGAVSGEGKKPGSTIVASKEFFDNILPHRGRAMILDAVEIFDDDKMRMVGIKEIREDDPCLEGHFPGDPVFPAHWRDEFFSLTCATLVLYWHKDIEGHPMITSMDGVRHKGIARPGDKIFAEVTLAKNRNNRFFVFKGVIRNQNGQIIDEYESVMGAAVK